MRKKTNNSIPGFILFILEPTSSIPKHFDFKDPELTLTKSVLSSCSGDLEFSSHCCEQEDIELG